MSREGADFADALKRAQELGYAEPDPTNDIEGEDARYKLAILASLAFRAPVQRDDIYREGITKLTAKDFRYAAELGYAIKLLALAHAHDGGIQARVHPVLLPCRRPAGEGRWRAQRRAGRRRPHRPRQLPGPRRRLPHHQRRHRRRPGRGAERHRRHARGYAAEEAPARIVPMSELVTRYYIRLTVVDQPGVLAQIAANLGDAKISIASVIQKEADAASKTAELVIMTHEAREASMQSALKAVAEAGRGAGNRQLHPRGRAVTTRREVPLNGDTLAWVHSEISEIKSRLAVVQQAAEQSRDLATDAAETSHQAAHRPRPVRRPRHRHTAPPGRPAHRCASCSPAPRTTSTPCARAARRSSAASSATPSACARTRNEIGRHFSDIERADRALAGAPRRRRGAQPPQPGDASPARACASKTLENAIAAARTTAAVARQFDPQPHGPGAAAHLRRRARPAERRRHPARAHQQQRRKCYAASKPRSKPCAAETNRITRIDDRLELVQAERTRHNERLNEITAELDTRSTTASTSTTSAPR